MYDRLDTLDVNLGDAHNHTRDNKRPLGSHNLEHNAYRKEYYMMYYSLVVLQYPYSEFA
jgi:hypothetical protein